MARPHDRKPKPKPLPEDQQILIRRFILRMLQDAGKALNAAQTMASVDPPDKQSLGMVSYWANFISALEWMWHRSHQRMELPELPEDDAKAPKLN